jgi:hypothetical protein
MTPDITAPRYISYQSTGRLTISTTEDIVKDLPVALVRAWLRDWRAAGHPVYLIVPSFVRDELEAES